MADRGRPPVGRIVEVRLPDEVVRWLDMQVRAINARRTLAQRPGMRPLMTRAQLIRQILESAARERSE